MAAKLSQSERQAKIASLLREQAAVSIPGLALAFGVSEMTVRRDLDHLAETGQARRTHGGAEATERMAFAFDFADRRRANQDAKRAIAGEALKCITPGQRLILDTGTTTLELAHLLQHEQNLTVLTPSLAVASKLQFAEGIDTVLLGGAIRAGSPELTGFVTETVLDMFSVDVAFQGADALGMDGTMYTDDMQVAQMDRKVRSRAAKTYLLIDSSKIGQTALAKHGHVSEIEAIITDQHISKKQLSALRKLGTQVITALI